MVMGLLFEGEKSILIWIFKSCICVIIACDVFTYHILLLFCRTRILKKQTLLDEAHETTTHQQQQLPHPSNRGEMHDNRQMMMVELEWYVYTIQSFLLNKEKTFRQMSPQLISPLAIHFVCSI